MIELKKRNCVPISEEEKQGWIRKMWESLQKDPSKTDMSIQSGDTRITMEKEEGVILVEEYRPVGSLILSVEDFEKLLKSEE